MLYEKYEIWTYNYYILIYDPVKDDTIRIYSSALVKDELFVLPVPGISIYRGKNNFRSYWSQSRSTQKLKVKWEKDWLLIFLVLCKSKTQQWSRCRKWGADFDQKCNIWSSNGSTIIPKYRVIYYIWQQVKTFSPGSKK